MNKYSYDNNSGYFNIYQAKSGAIYIMMGNCYTPFTFKQLNELNIDVYSLRDFDHELFLKYYGLPVTKTKVT